MTNTQVKTLSCSDCDDWEEGIKQIVSQSLYCMNRVAAPQYSASAFAFCPWCGGELRCVDRLKE